MYLAALPPATWRRRLAAHAIDSAIVLSIASVLAAIFAWFQYKMGGFDVGLFFIFFFFVGPSIASFIVALFMNRGGEGNGRSPGKQLMGVRVIHTEGKELGFWTTLFREVTMKWFAFWGASLLFFGLPFLANYLWPLRKRNPKNRALHDFFSRTQVVRTQPERADRHATPAPAGALGPPEQP